MTDGGEHLRGTDIGSAEHADFAVGMGQRGRPLDGVVAVVDFVLEGVPLAFGGVAAAHILDDDEVTTRRGGEAEGGGVLVVGRALRRTGYCHRRGVVDVGIQSDTVAGLHGDAVFYGDAGVLARRQRGRGRGRALTGFVCAWFLCVLRDEDIVAGSREIVLSETGPRHQSSAN